MQFASFFLVSNAFRRRTASHLPTEVRTDVAGLTWLRDGVVRL